MPQFDAEGIVEGLACKLKPFADFDEAIPEPSDRQIGEFLKGLKDIFAWAKTELGVPEGIDLADPDQMVAAIEALDPDKYVEFQDGMAALHAGLCGEKVQPDGTVEQPGKPSKAQILAVPLRRREKFYQWLQAEVMNPEAAPGAGTAQVVNLPRAAAG